MKWLAVSGWWLVEEGGASLMVSDTSHEPLTASHLYFFPISSIGPGLPTANPCA